MRSTAAVRSVKALVEANAAHNVYSNGVTAVNLPSTTAACQVAISLNAGSAHETASNPGAATFTRYCLGLSNYRNTGLLQQRMINLMGAKFETIGTRERTIVKISAGPKAIEELVMDVLVPTIQSPLFLKNELFFPWDQACRASTCPVDEAFHQASFSGGLSNKLGFYSGYGSDHVRGIEEREELLEELARNFHYSHYGMENAIVVGSGVSESFVEKVVQALGSTQYANQQGIKSKFQAGQVRTVKRGKSVAAIGIDVTGADSGAAAVVAAALGGRVLNYSDAQVIQFSTGSAEDLTARLAGLSSINVADATANAALAQLLKLGSGADASVASVASGAPIVDVGSASADAVANLAASVQSAPKSMVVLGDVHAFPQNTEI